MKKVRTFANYILTALLFAGCLYAIHDTQTAYGVGYFFSLKAASEARAVFDIVTDLVYFCIFLVLILIPVFACGKERDVQSIISLISKSAVLYSALMPIQRADYIITLFRKETYEMSMSLAGIINETASVFKILVPFLVLAVGFYICSKEEKPAGKWARILLITVALILPGLFVPALLNLSIFAVSYILTVVIFVILEKAQFKSELIYGFLYVAAVYNLVYVTAV